MQIHHVGTSLQVTARALEKCGLVHNILRVRDTIGECRKE
jgi:hypothetical protein